ncbi:hypothetical protein EBZ80_20625 [bacterium]|nr:hypothetical protein [bacterium]
MSHQFKRGRKKGGGVPYTIGNMPEIFWGKEVTQFSNWRTAARAISHTGIIDPAATKSVEAAQLDMISLCRRAVFAKDANFFVSLGKCLAAMPKDDWGNDPYALAIVTSFYLIQARNPAAKGMRLTKQDVCKLACSLLPPTKNYEAMRVALFKKMRQVMPELTSARSNSRRKATKRK